MEKPSTKKPMNVLKTMVFLKNFMYLPINKYTSDLNKLTIDQLTFDYRNLDWKTWFIPLDMICRKVALKFHEDVNFHTACKQLFESTANKQ